MKKGILLICLSAAMAACHGGNNSVDSSGNCTDQFNSDFNAISSAEASYNACPSCSSVGTQLISACTTFEQHHSTGITCNASLYGSPVSVDSTKVYQTCDQNTTVISANSSSARASTPVSTTTRLSKASSTADADGTCSDNFISDNNAIKSSLKNLGTCVSTYGLASCISGKQAAVDQCENFKAKYVISDSYKATVNGYDKIVDPSNGYETCDKFNALIQKSWN